MFFISLVSRNVSLKYKLKKWVFKTLSHITVISHLSRWGISRDCVDLSLADM